MQQKQVVCPCCLNTFPLTVGEQLGGKIALGLLGASLTKVHPVLGGVAALVGVALGHIYIDNNIIRNCPQCGQLLNIVNAVS